MMQINGLAEAALHVKDLALSAAFYTEVLGLPKAAAFDDAIFLQTGPQATLILFDFAKLEKRDSVIPDHGARGRGRVALAVPGQDMQLWRTHLREYGVTIEHEQSWPLGTHSIYFCDPDNNSIELIDESHYSLVWERWQKKE